MSEDLMHSKTTSKSESDGTIIRTEKATSSRIAGNPSEEQFSDRNITKSLQERIGE